MLYLQRAASRVGRWYMNWRFRQIFESETAFSVGVVCLGLLPVAMMLAALFIK
jgi:hypothetical protein